MSHKRRFSSSSAVEASGLQFQHRLFLRETGMLLPEVVTLEKVHQVLDVACGPGSWSIDLAKAYPQMHITGIDKNLEMLRIALEDARTATVTNVTFDVGDMLKGLPYTANYFDFVHVRQVSSAVAPQKWPAFLHEVLRVLRPGGWINLIDFEPGFTSSPSIDMFVSLVSKALVQAGLSPSGDGIPLTSAVYFPTLLSQAHCADVRYTLHPISMGGWNNPMGRAYMEAVLADDRHVIRFLVKTGVITQKDAEELVLKMQQEIEYIDYCGCGMLISAVGRKSETEQAT